MSDYTSFNFGKNPILMPIFLLILGYYFIRYCKLSLKPIILYISVFSIWTMLSIWKYGGNPGFHYPPFYSIIIAHIAFNIFNKDDFLRTFENILVKLCSLSLIVWLLANIVGDPFVNFMRAISVISPQPPTETNSFLVGLGSQFEIGLRRNIGFTWEPGVFSCWILLGMYVNLIRHKFVVLNIQVNKSFFILLATLFSTLSTTGYTAFAIILLFILINKRSLPFKLFAIIIVALILPTIIGLSFMGDKIVGLMDLDAGINVIEYHNSVDKMGVVTPQRFTGLYCSFLNFIHDPLLGYNQDALSYVSSAIFGGTVEVAPSEGILKNCAMYGVFVGLFFYYWLYKSSVYMSKAFHYKGTLMFLIFFVTISFSYGFWENCIFMYFYLCAFYKNFDRRYFDGVITR